MRLFWMKLKKRGKFAVVNVALALAALLMGVVMALSLLGSGPDGTPSFEPESLGNSQSNLANQGLVVSTGEWVYYADPSANYSVKRLHEEDGHMEDLAGVYGMYLNLHEDYLYYVDALTERLSRVRLTGTEIERLTEHTVSFAMLIGDQLVYTTMDDAGVYTCRTDGTREQKLSTVRTEQLLAVYDELLFSDLSRAGDFGRMNRGDGSGLAHYETKLGLTAVPSGNSVYFIDTRGNQRVYRAEYAGKSEPRVSDADIGLASAIATWEDALYFAGPENDGRLYCRRNARDTQITDFSVFAPQIVDGQVYVCRADEAGALYRVEPGTGNATKLP